MHNNISSELYENEKRRFTSNKLADQLSSRSNALTRTVRYYAVTGNPAYLETYEKLRASHRGIMPQLTNVVTTDDTETKDVDATKDTVELGNGGRVTHAEYSILQEGQRLAEALIVIEDKAIALLEAGEAAEAVQLLHNEAYSSSSARLQRTFDSFYFAVEKDTNHVSEELTSKKTQLFRNYGFLLFIPTFPR